MNRRFCPLILVSLTLPAQATPAQSANWSPVTTDFNRGHLESVAIAPTLPERVYAVSRDVSLFRSENGGEEWTDLTPSLPIDASIGPIAVSPINSDLVIIGIDDGTLRTTNGGDSWIETEGGLAGSRPDVLVFDLQDPAIVFAGTSSVGGGVYRSADGGLNWSRVTATFGDLAVKSIVLNPDGSGSILAGTTGGLLRSNDLGDSWTLSVSDRGFLSMSWPQEDTSTVYGTISDSLFKSTDAGATFSPVSIPDGFGPVSVAARSDDAEVVYLSMQMVCPISPLRATGQLFRSLDSGGSWESVFLAEGCGDVPQKILFHPNDADRLSFSSSGPNGFFTSTDAGDNWTISNDGISDLDIWVLDSGAGGSAYARGSHFTLRATDPLGTWTDLETPYFFSSFIHGFEANDAVPELVYECGEGQELEDPANLPYLIRSTDAGASWSPPPGNRPSGIFDVAQCVASAWNDTRVYAFVYDSVYRSDDGNGSYDEVSRGPNARKAAVDPMDPDHLFAAQGNHPIVQYSSNAGVTWSPRSTGLPTLDTVVAIKYDSADSEHLSLILEDSGAFETWDAGIQWSQVLSAPEKIRGGDWNPETGYYYLTGHGFAIVSNDPRITLEGLTTSSLTTVCFVEDSATGAGQGAVLAGGYRGLFSFPLGNVASTETAAAASPYWAEMRVSPNPTREQTNISIQFSSASIARDTIHLGIYDSQGRLVHDLQHSGDWDRQMQISWNGHDSAGRPVPNGTYWVQLRSGQHETLSQRLVVVR